MLQQASSPTLAPEAIAGAVQRAWESWLLRGRRQATPHAHVYASAWRACERRMVLEMTTPEALPAFPPEVLAKFRRGDDRERDLLADLSRIGRDADPQFEVVGQQERFELKDHKGRPVIVGKVDARLRVDRLRAPIEVKAWSPFLVDRIETFADVFENPWTRSGGYQLLSYLFGANEPFGFMLLDRSGLPLLLPVELDAHLDRMEEFLSKAERVKDHYEGGTLPDFLDDAVECKRCPFYGHTCNPPLSASDITVLTDPEFEAQLERWHALRETGKEFAHLDERIKKSLRGVENAIAGPFSITGKWQKSSRTELPPDIRKQYTVSDPKGRFFLEIEKL